jgi:L-alanine-DL-glutamate epimerase-like enolase superfamily enzyme
MWPRSDSAPITALRAQAYRIPTDLPEADGTFQWNATTLVLAHVEATGVTGIGFTYADASIASLIDGVLLGAIKGRNAFDIPGCWTAMYRAGIEPSP